MVKAIKTAKIHKILSVLLIFALLCSSVLFFTACGDDETAKKKENIQNKYAELVELSNDLTGAINVLVEAGFDVDQNAVNSYNESMEFMEEFGNMNMDGMSNAELDDLLESVNVMINSVTAARAALETSLDYLTGDEEE